VVSIPGTYLLHETGSPGGVFMVSSVCPGICWNCTFCKFITPWWHFMWCHHSQSSFCLIPFYKHVHKKPHGKGQQLVTDISLHSLMVILSFFISFPVSKWLSFPNLSLLHFFPLVWYLSLLCLFSFLYFLAFSLSSPIPVPRHFSPLSWCQLHAPAL
jgi:hypothetical protein